MVYRLRIRDESGVILPISLFVLFLFSLITMYAVTKFEMEKRSLAHIEETYDLELLLLMAYRDLEKQFTKDPAKKQGQFQYEYGFVNFRLLDETGNSYLFLFECYSESGELFMELSMPK
jgi:hypothetical protein